MLRIFSEEYLAKEYNLKIIVLFGTTDYSHSGNVRMYSILGTIIVIKCEKI